MNTLWNIIAVGAGGFIGATSRYAVCEMARSFSDRTGFPYGTLIVNLTGCLVIGLLCGWANTAAWFSPKIKLFLIIGILGSFTTFSTFGYDTLSLLQGKNFVAALFNISAHVGLGLVFVSAGYYLSTL